MIIIHASYQIIQLTWQGLMISQTFKWVMLYLLSPPKGNPTVSLFGLVPQCKHVIMTTAVLLILYLKLSITWTNIEILVIHYTVELPMERGIPLCCYMMQHSIHLWDISMLLISANFYSIWIVHAIAIESVGFEHITNQEETNKLQPVNNEGDVMIRPTITLNKYHIWQWFNLFHLGIHSTIAWKIQIE